MRTDTPIKNEHDRINDTFYIAKEEDVLSVSKHLIEQNRQAYEELDFETYSTNYLQVTWKNDEEYEPTLLGRIFGQNPKCLRLA